MRNTTALIFVCLVFFGCSINQENFRDPPHPANITVVYPSIGVVSSVSLGEELVRSATGYYSPALIIDNDFKISNTHRVSKGVYLYTHDDGKYRYYCPSYYGQLAELNVFGEDLSRNCRIRLSKSDGLSVIANTSFSLPSGEVFKSSKCSWKLDENHYFEDENSFQQTLIYTGKNDNIIKFSYREFSSNMIRDAFTTEVSYDLNESNIIAYKSFKAEIIHATNSSIEYKIISGF